MTLLSISKGQGCHIIGGALGPDSGAKILALKTALKLALDTILIL